MKFVPVEVTAGAGVVPSELKGRINEDPAPLEAKVV